MKSKVCRICLSLLLITISNLVIAQEKKDIKAMEKEMDNFLNQITGEFDNYLDKIDADFSNYLKNEWEVFELYTSKLKDEDPKPITVPKFTTETPIENPKEIPIEPNDNPETHTPKPKLPIVKRKEPIQIKTSQVEVPFYGNHITIQYDPALKSFKMDNIDENSLSQYWTNMSNINYNHLIDQIVVNKHQMGLNDWGYFLLIKKIANEIFSNSENNSKLLTWYLLTRSGYKAKIGFKDNYVFLLIPTANQLYFRTYYVINKLKYYFIDSRVAKVKTYKNDFPEAKYVLDLNIYSPLNISNITTEKPISFTYSGKTYPLKFKYNNSSIEFYKEYPHADIDIYFDAAVSRNAKESFVDNLLPLVREKSELDAVNLILNFVQTVFKYQVDTEQFGEEKFFFPEELLFYPYSDCEDRSVLFAYLVKELLNLKVIGLDYPGHIATAVKFNENVKGDYFIYKDEKYIICDPTFVNAPVGLTMPGYKDKEVKIVELKNFQNQYQVSTNIWSSIIASGGNRNNREHDIAFDNNGNAYVTGYFKGEANFGSQKLVSKNNSNDIFVAKYSNKGELIWIQQAGGTEQDISSGITIDNEGNCYITGSFNKDINFGENIMTASSGSDMFVAKYSSTGKLIWANQANVKKSEELENIQFASKFDSKGTKLWTKYYGEEEYFDGKTISLDDFGSSYITGSYYSTTGIRKDMLKIEITDSYDIKKYLKSQNDKLVASEYDIHIAGLFAVIYLIKKDNIYLHGKLAQEALDIYNPTFKKNSPTIHQTIGDITILKNSQGIVTVTTKDKKDLNMGNMKIGHNSKIKLIKYTNGNVRVEVLSGIKVGKLFLWYDLNYIKLIKNNGNILFDYDSDHTQKLMNLKRDILDKT